MSDEIDSGVLEVTLNLEDSNALREKLGLKPLNNKPPDQSKKEYDAWKKEKELAEKDKEVEKLMEKIFESREKRELTKKFESMKSIGDVENLAEYEAKNWIEKSRRLEYEKKKAKEQAKVFDELDEDVFVSEDTKKAKDYNLRYSGADLTGLTVQHDIRDIKEGTTILTLKDSSLRNAQDDVLESSEVVSLEKSREFIENRKRKKVYNVYGEDEFDEHGNPVFGQKSLLPQFDEEIYGKKKPSFLLEGGSVAEDKERIEKEAITEALRRKAQNLQVTLVERPDTYTPEEMLQFKKPKKKRRKLNGDISGAPKKNKLTAEDLLQCSAAVPEPLVDHGSRLRSYRKRDEDKDDESTITKVSLPPDLNGSFKENGNSRAALDLDSKKSAAFQEVLEDARDLETLLALERTKRLKERKVKPLEDQESKLAHALAFRREKDLMVLKKQEKEVTINGESDPLMFSANEEAIRNLGSSGYESHAAKLSKKLRSKEDKSGADEIIVSNEKTDKYALPEETLIKSSVSAALQVAKTIGLLSDLKGGTTTLILDSEQLRQQDELDSRTEREKDRDKYRHRARERALVDREKERERERETLSRRGQPFEEKKDYRPSVELVFKDEHGRILDQKHAFKHLSHRFHGNGPGKNKLEKLLKKEAIEKKLQSVKADDITMNKLKRKQKLDQKAFVAVGAAGGSIAAALNIKKQDLSKKKIVSLKTKSSKKIKIEN